MVGKRTVPLLLFLAMLVSVLISAPANGQTGNVTAQKAPAVAAGNDATAASTGQDSEETSQAQINKTLLTGDIGEPMAMDMSSDGRIFLTDRSGTVRIHNQETGQTTVAAQIDTYSQRHPGYPSNDPNGNNEAGLLGIALDPGFDQNGWIYLYYAHPTQPKVQLSRFDVNGDQIDLNSEIVMLEVESQRKNCCHVGADIEFDPDGNLYLSIGDETSPFESNGMAPLDERPGRETFDAQRTAGNTNDLRGKILRITPQPDGSYTIPAGNLFPESQDPGNKTRPEIYVMGARNPFRMEIDDKTGFLYYGMYGPGSATWDNERGPMGFDQFHEVRQASNLGWPFCTGNNYPYRPWDFATDTPAGDWFDCAGGPTNNSPNNDGLNKLPPVDPATIYYPIDWSLYPNTPPPVFLNMETGAGGPGAGPIYNYDPNLNSNTKFPESFDGKWFLLEWHRNFIKTATLDGNGNVTAIDDFIGLSPDPNDPITTLRPHDAMFGPDGSLYLLEYGSGWFGPADDNGLYRIDYVGGAGGGDDDDDSPANAVRSSGAKKAADGTANVVSASAASDVGEVSEEPKDPGVEAVLEPADPDDADDADGTYESPVTLTLESEAPDATLHYRMAGDEEWNTWTEPVTFDGDGEYDLEYRAISNRQPQEHTVTVGPGGSWSYSPSQLTVYQGDTIKYVLDSGYHNVVTVDDQGTEVATSGPPSAVWPEPYYYTATTTGRFYIYCTPHSGRTDPDPANWTGMVGNFDVLPVPSGEVIGEASFSIDQAPVDGRHV